jgi:hypothetical protein
MESRPSNKESMESRASTRIYGVEGEHKKFMELRARNKEFMEPRVSNKESLESRAINKGFMEQLRILATSAEMLVERKAIEDDGGRPRGLRL